jgi:hypothetical protein
MRASTSRPTTACTSASALPDGPERAALLDEAKRLMVAYMPYKVHAPHLDRPVTALGHGLSPQRQRARVLEVRRCRHGRTSQVEQAVTAQHPSIAGSCCRPPSQRLRLPVAVPSPAQAPGDDKKVLRLLSAQRRLVLTRPASPTCTRARSPPISSRRCTPMTCWRARPG